MCNVFIGTKIWKVEKLLQHCNTDQRLFVKRYWTPKPEFNLRFPEEEKTVD